MGKIRGIIDWANNYYMAVACMMIGIPLVGLMLMELVCWIYLQEINTKIVALESMF